MAHRARSLSFAFCLTAAAAGCGEIHDDVGLGSAAATTCANATFEAETSMTHSTGGAVSGGWNIWSNGNVSAQYDFATTAVRIDVVAKATLLSDGVGANMVVKVAGQQIGQVSVTAANWATFSFNFTPPSAGVKTVEVDFTNDAFVSSTQDRNLLVDKVTVTCTGAPATGSGGSTGTAGSGGTTGSAGSSGTVNTSSVPLASGSGATCAQFGNITAGGYYVQNNIWNDPDQSQCISLSGNVVTVTSSNHNKATNGPPASYPSFVYGCHYGNCSAGSPLPKQVSTIASALSVFSVGTAGGAWDLAYDIWLDTAANRSGQNNGAEIMIWLNSASVNPGGFPNKVASNVSIDGRSYDIYRTTMSGSGVSWNLISYRANPAVNRVDIDVKHFINDAISRGAASASWFLTSIQAGTEVWSGGTGLKLNAFGAVVK